MKRVAEQELADRDRQRMVVLVAEGAIARQQLDYARTRHETAARRVTEALHAVAAAEKRLKEDADDAQAELVRREAALEAARAAERSAAALETTAHEALRQVQATSRPARLETARLRTVSSTAALASARSARQEVLAREAEIQAKRAEGAQLEAQIAILTDEIRRSVLKAPCDGVVTTYRSEQRMDAHFKEGAAVLEIEDPRTLFVRIFVNEKEMGDVHIGQSVALRAAPFPRRLYHGRVSEIAPRAQRGGSAAFPVNLVEVRLRVANPHGELRPGTSGWAKIDCGQKSLGEILLRRVSRYVRTEVWSWF
jgi:HlyD family secretion protein